MCCFWPRARRAITKVAAPAQKTIASYDRVPGGGAEFGADILIIVATGNREHVPLFWLADCP